MKKTLNALKQAYKAFNNAMQPKDCDPIVRIKTPQGKKVMRRSAAIKQNLIS